MQSADHFHACVPQGASHDLGSAVGRRDPAWATMIRSGLYRGPMPPRLGIDPGIGVDSAVDIVGGHDPQRTGRYRVALLRVDPCQRWHLAHRA
jgi:hypothetical protein